MWVLKNPPSPRDGHRSQRLLAFFQSVHIKWARSTTSNLWIKLYNHIWIYRRLIFHWCHLIRYLLLCNQEYPFPPFFLFLPSYCIEGTLTTEKNFAYVKGLTTYCKSKFGNQKTRKVSKKILILKRLKVFVMEYSEIF